MKKITGGDGLKRASKLAFCGCFMDFKIWVSLMHMMKCG
jgi:hypothetical protein